MDDAMPSAPLQPEPEPENANEQVAAADSPADEPDLLSPHDDHAQREHEQPQATLYYDAATMAPLNAFSAAAVARLRAYRPPAFPLWDRLPTRRRAAVLVLLYADRWGDLRVVITMRAATLRNFSGHAALPGGKADSDAETPYHIARREAFEEIGLPMADGGLPRPFRIEQLCVLPPALARTHLIVTPCVAFLHADRKAPEEPAPTVDETMMPILDANEVAAVFSAPFYNFLKANDLRPRPGQAAPPVGHWYDGSWLEWKGIPWRVHNFYVPVHDQKVSRPRRGSAPRHRAEGLGRDEVEEELDMERQDRFKVWGMTGRVLVDAARIAYDEKPEIDHNAGFGDPDIIMKAEEEGAFRELGLDEPAKI